MQAVLNPSQVALRPEAPHSGQLGPQPSSGSGSGSSSGGRSSKSQLGEIRFPIRTPRARTAREAEAMSNEASLVAYSDAQVPLNSTY